MVRGGLIFCLFCVIGLNGFVVRVQYVDFDGRAKDLLLVRRNVRSVIVVIIVVVKRYCCYVGKGWFSGVR